MNDRWDAICKGLKVRIPLNERKPLLISTKVAEDHVQAFTRIRIRCTTRQRPYHSYPGMLTYCCLSAASALSPVVD